MRKVLHRYSAIALLLLGSALLFSCKEEIKESDESLDAIMTEKSSNLTIVVSENGRKSYRFTTPLLEGYTLGRDPYREFRKGIKITTFQDDSLTTVNATLESNYAIYYENRKLWEAKGNVRIVKHDGTKVFTQQLFWNSTTKRIYSNVDTKIVTADDTHYTEGFESDEDLVELNFRHWKGKVLMKEEMMQQGSDSTVVDKKSEEPQVEQKASQSIKRDTKRTNTTIRRTQPKSPTSLNRFDKTTDRLE
ncbi:MAG: LPS export ABC transporter periplasmic protein LptC [Alistipes sp.]|nr:LPS export ABC transporter periplasmic protein LptC [Alistipes sp.]